MNLSNIGHFIELSQVGQMLDSNIWLHSDPVSTDGDADVKKEVYSEMQFFVHSFTLLQNMAFFLLM